MRSMASLGNIDSRTLRNRFQQFGSNVSVSSPSQCAGFCCATWTRIQSTAHYTALCAIIRPTGIAVSKSSIKVHDAQPYTYALDSRVATRTKRDGTTQKSNQMAVGEICIVFLTRQDLFRPICQDNARRKASRVDTYDQAVVNILDNILSSSAWRFPTTPLVRFSHPQLTTTCPTYPSPYEPESSFLFTIRQLVMLIVQDSCFLGPLRFTN